MKQRHQPSYCDFSEASMLEHAVIIPPKLTGFAYGINNMENNFKEEIILFTNEFDDRTLIEYESILTEENLHIDIKESNFFSQAKVDFDNEKL